MAIAMSSQHQEQQPLQPSSPGQNEEGATKTISCCICTATYRPAPTHEQLLGDSPLALESAFMSMCHFCFRCRRPACPGCWDAIHGICGACVEEVGLPFRTEVPPLQGAFSLPRRVMAVREDTTSQPLVCIHPGRFLSGTPYSSNMSYATPTSPAPPIVKPAHASPIAPAADNTRIDPLPVQPVTAVKGQAVKRPTPLSKHIERALWILLSILLASLIILINAALFSEDANTFIAHILQVDIRMEIAYLLQMIRHLL